MTKRTDLAAPSVIDPATFHFVAGVYFGSNPDEDFDELLGLWMAEKDVDGKAGWYSKRPAVLAEFPPLNPDGNFVRKGTCDHCGARFDWGSVYAHTSGLHIVVGNVCADKTMTVPSRLELDVSRMKARIAAARKAARLATTAREQAVREGIEWLYCGKHEHKILDDIARNGLKWGTLSMRQLELVRRIHSGTKAQWEIERDARIAARAAEKTAAQPVPVTDKRLSIKAVVLMTREQDGYMGATVLKMLVRAEAGFKLWGSVPRNLLNDVCHDNAGDETLRGKTVEFCAMVTRSDRDEKFGFFSRPTKARVIATTTTTKDTRA